MTSHLTWKTLVYFIGILLLASACNKNDTPAPDDTKTGAFSIEFDNIVGDETLDFHPREYTNAKGEKFTITSLRYFVSNIKLYQADGSAYMVPQEESYFLVNAEDRTTRFTPVMVPEGNYTRMSFILGVDSLRSTMPVEQRTGVLSFDPEHGHEGGGMYWGWNSGYIFVKFEGLYHPAGSQPSDDGEPFRYHIGGFGGYSAPTINNIKEIKLDLTQGGIAQVREGLRSNAHLLVDVLKIFDGPNAFSIKEHPNVMFSEYSVNIANNFPSMFRHDHTENFVKDEEEL